MTRTVQQESIMQAQRAHDARIAQEQQRFNALPHGVCQMCGNKATCKTIYVSAGRVDLCQHVPEMIMRPASEIGAVTQFVVPVCENCRAHFLRAMEAWHLFCTTGQQIAHKANLNSGYVDAPLAAGKEPAKARK